MYRELLEIIREKKKMTKRQEPPYTVLKVGKVYGQIVHGSIWKKCSILLILEEIQIKTRFFSDFKD